jgi:hypothetical protein
MKKKTFFFVKREKQKIFFQMANHKWDLKSNYMLAFTICKYGLNPERWNLVANDLADYIKITPQVKIKMI